MMVYRFSIFLDISLCDLDVAYFRLIEKNLDLPQKPLLHLKWIVQLNRSEIRKPIPRLFFYLIKFPPWNYFKKELLRVQTLLFCSGIFEISVSLFVLKRLRKLFKTWQTTIL